MHLPSQWSYMEDKQDIPWISGQSQEKHSIKRDGGEEDTLFLVDWCPAYPKDVRNSQNVWEEFFPANMSLVLQPIVPRYYQHPKTKSLQQQCSETVMKTQVKWGRFKLPVPDAVTALATAWNLLSKNNSSVMQIEFSADKMLTMTMTTMTVLKLWVWIGLRYVVKSPGEAKYQKQLWRICPSWWCPCSM
jgi:hypothetical protein